VADAPARHTAWKQVSGAQRDPRRESARKEKAALMTYVDTCIHQNGVFCLLKVSQTSGISFALFLPEPLLVRPLLCENQVRSELRVSACDY